jgi:hypothetical protein
VKQAITDDILEFLQALAMQDLLHFCTFSFRLTPRSK